MARTSEIISLIQNLTEEQLERLKRFILTKLNFVTVATASIRPHDCPQAHNQIWQEGKQATLHLQGLWEGLYGVNWHDSIQEQVLLHGVV